jgi:DNA-binding response OmpR family regulator
MKQYLLVVDDEKQVRDLLALYFRKRGYEVSTAATSSETLQAVRDRAPDLVVLDIGLEEEDGLKLLGALKRGHPAIRVIMLTGMGFDEELLEEARQHGADGYVSKELPFEELLSAIQQVLQPPEPCPETGLSRK